MDWDDHEVPMGSFPPKPTDRSSSLFSCIRVTSIVVGAVLVLYTFLSMTYYQEGIQNGDSATARTQQEIDSSISRLTARLQALEVARTRSEAALAAGLVGARVEAGAALAAAMATAREQGTASVAAQAALNEGRAAVAAIEAASMTGLQAVSVANAARAESERLERELARLRSGRDPAAGLLFNVTAFRPAPAATPALKPLPERSGPKAVGTPETPRKSSPPPPFSSPPPPPPLLSPRAGGGDSKSLFNMLSVISERHAHLNAHLAAVTPLPPPPSPLALSDDVQREASLLKWVALALIALAGHRSTPITVPFASPRSLGQLS
jgi:hypothetical protein